LMTNGPHWHATKVGCSPKKWAAKTWHHIQIASHRSGDEVFYDAVTFDGEYHAINEKGHGTLDLHWSPGSLSLNFQLDGANSRGEITLFQDKLTVFYW
jgi:hypothetical protein